jgi:protein-S-isoprenylcysteine O-methyltransferase Ste14
VYASAVIAGALLTWLWPLPGVLPAAVPIGGTLVLAAVVLFVLSIRALQAAGTPVPGDRPTTAVVRTGPYRFSRNPIYLGFSLLQLGIAGMVNSLWLLVTLVPAVALMSLVVIPREERYLEARFPGEYRPYKAAVRRWL